MLRMFTRGSPILGMTLVQISNLLFRVDYLSAVGKVEISKSTDKRSNSFKVEIYETAETAESPKTDSTVGLTRFVGNKIKRMSKLD